MIDQETTATAGDLTLLERRVTHLLNLISVGGLADSVADRLRARAIKGVQHDECECPLARLIRTLPDVEQVEVGPFTAIVYPSGVAGTVEIDLSKAASDFVWDFDRGVHLDLIEFTGVAR